MKKRNLRKTRKLRHYGGMLKETEERLMLEDKLKAISSILKAAESADKKLARIRGAQRNIEEALYIQESKDISEKLRRDIKPLLDRLAK
jgi:hypothetical protein